MSALEPSVDCPACPSCGLHCGVPRFAADWNHRADPGDRIVCPACGNGWVGSETEVRQAIDAQLSWVCKEAVEAEREACARLVALASVKSPSPIDGLGSCNLDEMNDVARTAIHGACQLLAMAIRARGGK